MALGITAALAGDLTPQAVQVVVTGMTAGQAYTVTGSWAGGSWPVRGGVGVAAAAQLVFADVAAPINTPVTYTVQHNGAMATSSAVTVAIAGRIVLALADGSAAVAIPSSGVRDNRNPRRRERRQATFEVEGRPDPVVRYTIAPSPSSSIVVRTAGAQSFALDELLATGAPLMLRTDGALRDLPATAVVMVSGDESALTGLVDDAGVHREWTLPFRYVGDPEPNTVVPVATWEDFDAYYAASTWNAFDTQWAAASWNDYDAFDWE